MDLSDHLPSLITIPDIFVTKLTTTKKEVRKLTDSKIADINKELGKLDWDLKIDNKSTTCNNITNVTLTSNNNPPNLNTCMTGKLRTGKHEGALARTCLYTTLEAPNHDINIPNRDVMMEAHVRRTGLMDSIKAFTQLVESHALLT